MRRKTALARKTPKKKTEYTVPGQESPPALLNAVDRVDANIPSAQDECWAQDIIILRKVAEELVSRRHRNDVASLNVTSGRFREIADSLDHPDAEIRSQAVKDLYQLDADGAATLVNDALRDGSQEQRRKIGTALADSGLLLEAIDDLMNESHERCYGAFSLLLLVAKAGVVQPLITVIEKHPSLDLRLAVIRLLASSNEKQVVTALQNLCQRNSLPPEIKSAALKAIAKIG